MDKAQDLLGLGGRILLGLYFLLPGIQKIFGFEQMSQYMESHGMILVPFFLVLTIIMQIGGAICLFINYRTPLVAFLLAGLVLVISLVMHNFWAMPEGMERGHEMQNFIKNLAIMAGLMVLAGSSRTRPATAS